MATRRLAVTCVTFCYISSHFHMKEQVRVQVNNLAGGLTRLHAIANVKNSASGACSGAPGAALNQSLV